MASPAPLTLAIHTVGLDRRQAMVEDVTRGLRVRPRRLPSQYFYDERGSELFEQITELPEYYLTRAERAALDAHGREIVAATRPESMVELGAGSCSKTRVLLSAGRSLECLRSFVAFDISEAAVSSSARELVRDYPGLTVYGLVGEFGAHLDRIPRMGRQLVLFLGSTIGNFDDVERVSFLTSIRAIMAADDHLLLGVDLVKDRETLEAAYNDAQGVTAEFNRNLLCVLNRELGADFEVGCFAHVSRYSEERSRIETDLRSLRRQRVRIPAAGLELEFEEGELVRTEISAKFTRESTEEMLAAAGLRSVDWFTDPEDRFGLVLAAPI
jgi:L-histidine N-alpha-methyltransferase